MSAHLAEHDLAALPKASASELRQSWRDVLLKAVRFGRVAVTHHSAAEAVVVSIEEYERMHAAERELAALKGQTGPSPLDALTESFKQRMVARDPVDFSARLEKAAATPVRLRRRLQPGEGF